MVVYNTTGIMGVMLEYTTTNITGSLFLTFLMIFAICISILMIFRVPFEITIPILSPLLIIFAIVDQGFFKILGLVIIIGSMFIVKKLFENK